MPRKIAALFLLACLLAGSRVQAEPLDAANIQASELTAEQAKQVLTVVLKHLHYKMSNRDLWIDGPWPGDEKGTLFRPGYYDFGLVYSNPKAAASNVLGHYAVNATTGDVWETERCRRYRFPALSAIQERISARTGRQLASDAIARGEIGCD